MTRILTIAGPSLAGGEQMTRARLNPRLLVFVRDTSGTRKILYTVNSQRAEVR
jgi:hypothetical protein